mmetsp:Transcript_11651/g.25530  ORF Transcript_11651/g.25530 Transcript_11651/m.25530 type:complete len:737 (+) Transcript_11651:75-2285(+)|eukprot:CAMPEP_0172330058 /NCGR_PEP_ID=MMETSP1058-20130122/61206_1 /TAXON_ID=83371 /ORGANISM="Detonula confervacea, Strain CCMP 353" /LENGTH=736 /DNA_ID=CAMNT_0013047257 /DNA_START=35 /DNA_END=2245 /DNA_ORIENTATION=+
MTTKIQGWTPKTDFLLRCPSSAHDHDAETSNDIHGGYDIIDLAFGRTFPSELLNELQANGWIENIEHGIKGKLKPARTKMDVDMGNLLQSFINPFIMSDDNDDNATNISKGDDGMTRGDESAFISRQERMKDSFSERHPLLHTLISSIESTACRRLGKSTSMADSGNKINGKNECVPSDNTTHFEFDSRLTSVQIAKYPGDGQAGYPRHCDRGATCTKESTNPKIMRHDTETESSQRLLTFVYYLTPSEWDSELDGGALRMFSPIEQNIDHNDNDTSDAHYFDVTPYSNRLVVFRSDIMEHEVMPSLRRDRVAITVWLYGRAVYQSSNTEHASLTSNDFGLDYATLDYNGVGKEISNSSLPPPLPISSDNAASKNGDKVGDKSIFVAIPSYRDEETWPTIKSLVETACHPEKISVAVVFQVDTMSKEEVQFFTTAKGSGISIDSSQWNQETNFRSITMDYRHSTGPCYARHLAQTLHRGEDYVLQIDSHMRFRPNWDEYLVQQLNKTKCPDKALLTSYPPGYEPPNGPGPNAETRATILVPWKFGGDGMLRQKGRLLRPDYQHDSDNDNVPCLLYAGGFNFFHSSLLDICPYDSKLHLFFGEEISMAVRLYTHGIDLYAPPQTVCYHFWKRNPLRVRDENNSVKVKQRGDALDVVRMQLRGLGRGLGTFRSVEKFSEALGIDFYKQTLTPGCENAGLSDNVFVSPPSDEKTKLCNDLTGEDMSSVLKLVCQFMTET